MPRENTYNAIILKKQPYLEADEIITFYTEEAGKLRGLAKSVKFAKSKLQQSLQAGFLVQLTLAGKNLPKIIGSEVVNPFANIRENLAAVSHAFYAIEAVLKATPDEQKNQRLFNLLLIFLTFLDLDKARAELLNIGLAKFKIEFLESLGFGIHAPEEHSANNKALGRLSESKNLPWGFSVSRGSFIQADNSADVISVKPLVLGQFWDLQGLSFSHLIAKGEISANLKESLEELQALLSRFIEYQLDREIKSDRYL